MSKRRRARPSYIPPARPARPTHGELAAVAAFVLAVGFIYILSLRAYYVGFFNDDAFYLIGSRSLWSGHYAELNQPGHPPLLNYLPGYAVLLAPLSLLWRVSTVPHQLLSVLLTVLTVAVTWLFWRRESTVEVSAAALLMTALNPLTVSLSGTVLSDVPFTLVLMLAMFLLREVWTTRAPHTWAVIGALLSIGYYLRPVGLTLAGAVGLSLLLEKRAKPAFAVVGAAVGCASLFMLRNFIVAGVGLPYFGEMAAPYQLERASSDVSSWISGNGRYYLYELFARTLFRWPPSLASKPTLVWAGIAIGTLALLIGLLKWGVKGWRKNVPIFLFLYAVVHLVWAKQSGRYLLPILPLASGFVFLGLASLFRGEVASRWTVIGAAAVVLAALTTPVGKIVTFSLFEASPINRPPERTYGWIRENTRPDDIFAVELDGRFYLHTGREAYRLPNLLNPAAFEEWLRERHVRYVVAESDIFIMKTAAGGTANDPYPVATLEANLANPAVFERVWSDPGEQMSVFRLIESGPV